MDSTSTGMENGKQKRIMNASMKTTATALTMNPMAPGIQKYPGSTFLLLVTRCGRIALVYEAMDTKSCKSNGIERVVRARGTYRRYMSL